MDFGMPEPLCNAYQIADCYRYAVSSWRMIRMEVKVEFEGLMEPPSAMPDHQDDLLTPEVLRDESYEFWFDINSLSGDAAGEQTVRDMLTRVGVMYTADHEFMVQTILCRVASVARDRRNGDLKVLTMRVLISCVDPSIHQELMVSEDEGLASTSDEADYMDVDESGDDYEDDYQNDDDDYEEEYQDDDDDDDDCEEDAGPGLEGLTEGEVTEGSIDCAICCDHIPVGSTGSSMPCRHVYHWECIAEWLRKSRTCPLCRFQLPS